MARRRRPKQIYQLRIDLAGIRPPIWRRVLVPDNVTLAELHEIIQTVMGWWGYHLHAFRIGGLEYGVPSPDDFHEVRDERRVRLRDVIAGVGSRFRYEYDFGDSWEHVIKVEKVLDPEPGVPYPVCIKGKRACPPEDVGGVWGYAEFLEAIADPNHPEHEDMVEWVGDEFDPEEFDLDEINARL